MQKNIYLFNVTLAEFYRHDCRISESISVATLENYARKLGEFLYGQNNKHPVCSVK